MNVISMVIDPRNSTPPDSWPIPPFEAWMFRFLWGGGLAVMLWFIMFGPVKESMVAWKRQARSEGLRFKDWCFVQWKRYWSTRGEMEEVIMQRRGKK